MKKIILGATVFFWSFLSLAVPVMNENVANSGMVTIYPDHQNPHRFYIAPNVVTIASDKNGRPYFSYNEFRVNLFLLRGSMQMTLVPAYTREDLLTAENQILQKDSEAQFSGLPFVSSTMSLTGNIPSLVVESKCDHSAGLIGQEQACSIILTQQGRLIFYDSIDKKTLFTTLQFEYKVQGFVRKADGTFGDQIINHGVAVRIDGGQLSKFPELINRH